MMLNEDREKAIQYLYGELGESDRDALEERIFSDEDFSLFLESAEKDLIDEYVRGEMDFAERERFEKKYLVTERRREQVRIASILQKEVFAEKESPKALIDTAKPKFWETLTGFFKIPTLAWAGGLAVLLLGVLLIGLVILRQNNKPDDYAKGNNSNVQISSPSPAFTPKISPPENVNVSQDNNANKIANANQSKNINQTQVKTPEKKPAPTMTPTEKRETAPPPNEQSVFLATLLPPLRSGANPVLKIPNSAKTVRLQLFDNFGQKYEQYIVELNDNGGNPVWSHQVKAAKGAKSITINIPNSLLKTGNHEIAVRGKMADGNVEEINFYNFTVQRN